MASNFVFFIETKTMLNHDESMGGISLDDENTFKRCYNGGRNYLGAMEVLTLQRHQMKIEIQIGYSQHESVLTL